MSALSDYLETAVLAWIKGTDMATAPAAVYVALFDGDPGDAGASGTDETATIRPAGRVAATFGAVANDVSSGGEKITNDADIDFGTSEGSATIDYVAIYDAATDGNLLFRGALDSQVSVSIGNSVKFTAGDLVLSIT